MTDTFIANVEQEGKPAFAENNDEKETKTPSAPLADTKQEGEAPASGDSTKADDNIPFHTHPRWIERENELKELRERDALRENDLKELKEFRQKTETKFQQSETLKIPQWFSTLYGENAEAWTQYQSYDKQNREEIKKEILESQKEEQEKAQKETTRWNKWVDDEVGKLQTSGKQFDRNELIKTILEYKPIDDNGNYSFEKGFQILEALKSKDGNKESVDIKKKVASSTMSKGQGDSKTKDFYSPNDLRGGWSNIK